MPFRSDYLKELREAKGWSQQDLSKRSGLSQSVIAKSESGKNSPGSDALDKMAEALDCTIDYLHGRGPDYRNARVAAAHMAFDVLLLRNPLTKQQRERCRRALQHVDAPRTSDAWRSLTEMLDLAVGSSQGVSLDLSEEHPPKPKPMSVARRRHQ